MKTGIIKKSSQMNGYVILPAQTHAQQLFCISMYYFEITETNDIQIINMSAII